jgi:ATP-binding cassette, subfamily C, bacterial
VSTRRRPSRGAEADSEGDGPIRSVRLLVATAWGRARSLTAGAVILVIAASAVQGAGLLLLIPLLTLAGVGDAPDGGRFLPDRLTSLFSRLPPEHRLPTVLAIFVAILLLQAAVERAQTVTVQRLTSRVATAFRERLYSALLSARWTFLLGRRTGADAHLLTGEADRAAHAALELIHLLTGACLATLYLGFALATAPVLTLVATATAGLLWLTLRARVVRSRALGENLSQSSEHFHRSILEHMGGLKIARTLGAEDLHRREFSSAARALEDAYVASVAAHAGVRLRFSAGAAVLLALLVFTGVRVLSLGAATVLVLLFVFARLLPRIIELQQLYQQLLHALPAVDRIESARRAGAAASEGSTRGRRPPRLEQQVAFAGVEFVYPDGRKALHGVDLVVPAGAVTAVVGPTGAGKSTLADLLLGLLPPTSGHILLDGVPLDSCNLKEWRTQVGYVSQETFLFDASIRANLLLAAPMPTRRPSSERSTPPG